MACFRLNLYLTTGLMLLWGCSGQSWSELVKAEFFYNSSSALITYNFNQHFDNLHLEASLQTTRQCSLGRGGCQFRGVFNPLRVWHQQEDIYFEEQSSFQAPRVTQWAWVSLRDHFLVGGMQVNTHMCSLTSKHAFPPSLPLYLPPSRLLTPLCPPRLGRCSQRRCHRLRPELSPSPGCCSRKSSETQKSAGSAASPPPSAPAEQETSLVDGT